MNDTFAGNICGAHESDSILEGLRRCRPEYWTEHKWHRFLADAFFGSGGFMGDVRMPLATWWGAAADMYSPGSIDGFDIPNEAGIDTYLDRFQREDLPKFERRVSVAHYPNYIGPIVDTKLSFLNRQEFAYEAGNATGEWMEDIDGTGRSWERFMARTVRQRAAILGWCPVVIDAPSVPEGVSAAQAAEAGFRVKARALFPSNILDWDEDEYGSLRWVKIQTFGHSKDPMGKCVNREIYTIWTRTSWRRFVVEGDENNGNARIVESTEGANELGEVPVVFFRFKGALDSGVKGIPIAWSESQEARRLFNLLSELDEHVRGSVFAVLAYPVDDPDLLGELQIGSNNALAVSTQSSNMPAYLAPPASVAATIVEMIVRTINEIYRMARLEFTRGTRQSAAATSGVSKAFEFEDTNRSIADAALALAVTEHKALELVAAWLGDAQDAVSVTPPAKFNVEELMSQLDEATAAISIGFGPTFNAIVKKRLVSKVLPNLSPELEEQIENEIDANELESEQRKAQQSAAEAAFLGLGFSEPEDEEDAEESEEEPAQAQ